MSHDSVPYFVLTLNDGRAKAVFTVPESTLSLDSLTGPYPILCRGSSFALEVDAISNSAQQPLGKTRFLSTQFYSPDPAGTALDISRRIAMRIANAEEALSKGESSGSINAAAMIFS